MKEKGMWTYLILLLVLKLSQVFTQFVESPAGTFEGTIVYDDDNPVEAYLGIPYAKPPIGQLRFRKPVPIDPFLEPKEVLKFGAGCLQYSENPFPWLDNLPGLSEDCLFLNIWAPVGAKDSEKKAVIFFIHGGGYTIGSSRVHFLDGRTLAKEGDVIVVTINYRLGPLGFIDFGVSDAAGNMGLYDILEALKWVNKNIESFGGDRNKITLFGWSAGAVTAGVFCVSPLAKDLFRRVVMSSGSPTNMYGEDDSQDFKISGAIAKEVGCLPRDSSDPETIVECLRGVSGMELILTSNKVQASFPGRFYIKPGDEILPTNARQALIDADFKEIEILIGSNDGDGSTELTKAMTEVFGFFGEKEPQINKTYGESIIRQQFKTFKNPDGVVQQYLKDVPDDNYEEIRFQVATASGDYTRVCTTSYFAEIMANKSNGVYYYFFTHHTEKGPWAPWMRAPHFEDIPYFFGYVLRNSDGYTSDERNLSRDMVQILTNFVKYGHPSQNWPTYSKDCRLFNYIDTVQKGSGIGPDLSNCEFFRPYFGF